jgi:hypothetical protein
VLVDGQNRGLESGNARVFRAIKNVRSPKTTD